MNTKNRLLIYLEHSRSIQSYCACYQSYLKPNTLVMLYIILSSRMSHFAEKVIKKLTILTFLVLIYIDQKYLYTLVGTLVL